VEGRATLARLEGITSSIVLVDDAPDDDRGVLGTHLGGLEALLRCEVVLKSPGISRYREDVVTLVNAGVNVTSALNLWLNGTDRTKVIAVTGTKGKSTTTSLISFFLTAMGESAHSAGNIGSPPYDPAFVQSGWIVLEVSSFQAVELDRAPGIVVVTALGADHLDWHGSLSQYHSDKLSLTRAHGDHVTFVTPELVRGPAAEMIGGNVQVVNSRDQSLASALGLLGDHNAVNVQLALHAVAQACGVSVGEVRQRALNNASQFVALAGRLTLVRTMNSVRFVDDSLATAPLPTIAALAVFADEPVSLIVGGYDRGVDYTPLAEVLAQRHAPTTLITMPDAGDRIAQTVKERTPITSVAVSNMPDAVREARSALTHGGVVLLSPAAASFGQYANWRERSDDFTRVVNNLSE
jgi:UDP-N-acetylmuramoylalanine--D-glutamate ligase